MGFQQHLHLDVFYPKTTDRTLGMLEDKSDMPEEKSSSIDHGYK